jgi:tRNA (guanine37-N1)-methyltransferase
MIRFDVLTIFPEMFSAVLDESIIGRAQKKGIIKINTVNIRDYSKDKHKKTDDYPYGGGEGMVMMVQPVFDAYSSIKTESDSKPHVIYLTPQGTVLNQDIVSTLSSYRHLILLCGHYEGIDERIIEEIVDEEVSVGDYVLTGGELPAMIVIDAVSRVIPGVLSSDNSYKCESHYNGLIEYPQYTRPYEFNGKKVPDVLLSGNHKNIEKWRKRQSIKRTYVKRPDLFKNLELNVEDMKLLNEVDEEET